jgi:hypothetical protein
MTLVPDDDYGGLYAKEENVAGIEVTPTDPPDTWQLQMTRPGGGNLQNLEVEDVLLVLGYEWK